MCYMKDVEPSQEVARAALAALEEAIARLGEARTLVQGLVRTQARPSALPQGIGKPPAAYYEAAPIEPQPFGELWVTVREAAQLLSLSEEQVRRNLRSGRFA